MLILYGAYLFDLLEIRYDIGREHKLNPKDYERRFPMSRKKRTSPPFEKLAQRLSGLKAIDPKLDLGNNLTVDTVSQQLLACNSELEEYNMLLGNADSMLNSIEKKEEAANNLSEQVLLAVAAKFGKDSSEYEMAGGKRKSDIKRNSPRKPKTKAVAQ